MKKLKKLTDVFFQDTNGQWFKKQIDLKAAQKKLKPIEARSKVQPDALACEMMLDIIELVRQKHLNFECPFIITDIGDGKSNAANTVGKYWSANVDGFTVTKKYGGTLEDIANQAIDLIKGVNDVNVKQAEQISVYDFSYEVTVQNYDESVKAYAEPIEKKADIVFCNSLLARTLIEDVPSLVEKIKQLGKYVFLTIPLIPSAGYVLLKAKTLMKKAQAVSQVPNKAIILERKGEDDYLLPANISVLSKKQWQQILGPEWVFVPSTDCTCVSAMNFTPSEEFAKYKRKIVEKCGFADQMPFPSPIKSPVEKDTLLSARNAAIQPLKHLMRLGALKPYPNSDFKVKEIQKSKAFLKAVGLSEGGDINELDKNFVEKLLSLEKQAKSCLIGKEKPAAANQLVAKRFAEIIGE